MDPESVDPSLQQHVILIQIPKNCENTKLDLKNPHHDPDGAPECWSVSSFNTGSKHGQMCPCCLPLHILTLVIIFYGFQVKIQLSRDVYCHPVHVQVYSKIYLPYWQVVGIQ